MKITIAVVFVLAFLTILYSCNNSPISPYNAGSNNLLSNPFFEINGSQSLDGWRYYAILNFSNEIPPVEGAKWSIAINAYNPLSLMPISLFGLYQDVHSLNGKSIYCFSFWAKMDSCIGKGSIYAYSADSLTFVKSIEIENPYWTKYNIIDTLLTSSLDSIGVNLSSGFYTGQNGGKMLVANCSLIAQ